MWVDAVVCGLIMFNQFLTGLSAIVLGLGLGFTEHNSRLEHYFDLSLVRVVKITLAIDNAWNNVPMSIKGAHLL